MRTLNRRFVALLTSLMLLFTLLPSANAAMMDNQSLYAQTQLDQQRQELRDLLARDDVRDQLISLGADLSTLDQRIDNLTATELAQINGKLEELPAGSGVVGLVVLVFIIFVITDVIGATDIFPFIHPVR